MTKLVDLSGRVFDRLTVIERAANGPRGTARWLCKCECGVMVEHYSSNLIRGRVYYCGTPCVLVEGRTPWPRDPRYFVGRDGSVVSPNGVLLKHLPNGAGYPVIGIYPNGRSRPIGVHILVAETYLGPKPDGMEVAHEDGNPANPCVENLRWSTRVDNMADKIRHGTHLQGEQVQVSKLTEDGVRAIRQASAAGESDRSIAARYGVTPQNIRYVVRRATWKHI